MKPEATRVHVYTPHTKETKPTHAHDGDRNAWKPQDGERDRENEKQRTRKRKKTD